MAGNHIHLDIVLRDRAQLDYLKAIAKRLNTSPSKILLASFHLATKATLQEMQEALADVLLEFHPQAQVETLYLLLVEAHDPQACGLLFLHDFPYRENEYFRGINEEGKVVSLLTSATITEAQINWIVLHDEVLSWDIVRQRIVLEEETR